MKLSKEILQNHSKLYDKLEELQTELNTVFRNAKENAKTNLIKYKNAEGEEIEVTEEVAWLEVRYSGFDCPAGIALDAIYPKVKELKDAEEVAIEEVKAFEIKEFGFDYGNLSLRNTIKLINALVDYRLEEKK